MIQLEKCGLETEWNVGKKVTTTISEKKKKKKRHQVLINAGIKRIKLILIHLPH